MSRRKKQNTFTKLLTFLILSLLVVFLLLSNLRIYRQRRQHLSIIDQLEEKEKELLQEKEKFEKKLEQVHSEESLERIAREQLNLIRPGERVVVIKIEEPEKEVATEEESSFWDFDWLFFR